jgi:hypothetical protein
MCKLKFKKSTGIFIVFLILSCATLALAKDLYVSPTGDDNVSYEDNQIDTPWTSPAMAWAQAKANDIVYFRGGTYNIEEQINTKYIGNTGSEGSPIIFTSYSDEQAVFSTTLTGRVFEIQRDYNHVSNINFIGAAPTWFHLGEDIPAHHFEIRNCNVKLGTGGDNTGFVMTSSRSDYLVVENCTIEGPGTGVHQNTACLYLGSADYLSVKNNTMYNSPIGIYFKTDNDENSGNEIAYNYIYNCPRNSIQTNSQYTNFHNNIIGPNCGSFQINEGNGFALGDNNTINHNTIMSGGLLLNSNDGGADNNIITNNIVSTRESCCDENIWDFNLYISGAVIGSKDISSESPIFIVSNPSNANDYTLDPKSAGYRVASDGTDIGVSNSKLVGDILRPSKVIDFKN